jgi:erythromycin 3''-O-methyltransferase
MSRVTRANLRHLLSIVRRARNPAAVVYDSIGSDFFLEPAPGFLNLGLWEGESPDEAEEAVRRLVATVAAPLPKAGVIVDVGNGLGGGDLVIAEVARPSVLVALNITESQLRAGRRRLRSADASPVVGDAVRIPLRDDSVDGVISVEAAFHFSSRADFLREAARVLRPGGVLSFSDVSAERWPLTPGEVIAGLLNLRVWGVTRRSICSADEIGRAATRAGFGKVDVKTVGHQVFPQAITFFRARLSERRDAPLLLRLGTRVLLWGWDLLFRRGVLQYELVTARVAPDA